MRIAAYILPIAAICRVELALFEAKRAAGEASPRRVALREETQAGDFDVVFEHVNLHRGVDGAVAVA